MNQIGKIALALGFVAGAFVLTFWIYGKCVSNSASNPGGSGAAE